jgi:hopanoid C-3 methylase HpnR
MKVLCCHPSGLMYTKIFLRLEPLGLELVAAALRRAGHDVRLLDLQVSTHKDFFKALDTFRPDALCFSVNYLANIPEVIDLCRAAKERMPNLFVFVGGHSASFTAAEILEHAQGAIDCVARGEGEVTAPAIIEAVKRDRVDLDQVPGVVTLQGSGAAAGKLRDLDDLRPERDLLPQRRKYFIGLLDPCASIEFTRGCPWDCSFCSAWTFYGRSYRQRAAESIGEELAGIREPGVFIVDDVAFIHADHGFAIGREIEKRKIRKKYYLETRGDVLLRNKEVFRYWKRLGLEYMFLGLEAIDEEGLKLFRKRVTLSKNFEALEFARSLGIRVAVNIIADPDWDAQRFAVIRDWALSVPEIVNVSVNTPYPGTESFLTEARKFTTRDYRLFDIQHAVLPTKLPLKRFYEELVSTQQVLNKKHLGFAALKTLTFTLARLLAQGQTNFARSLFSFHKVYDARLQMADHQQPVRYEMRLPEPSHEKTLSMRDRLYVIPPPASPEPSTAEIS